MSWTAQPTRKWFSQYVLSVSIIAVGDSLTEGYGVPAHQAFPARLEAMWSKPDHPVRVTNAGISGSTTASALGRLKWLLKKTDDADKPDLIIIALGANDGLRGFDLKVSRQNLEQSLALIKESQIQALLAGMKLPLNYGANYRAGFEKVFSDLGSQPGLWYLPFLLDDVATNSKLMQTDRIHPNAAGHEQIARNINQLVCGKYAATAVSKKICGSSTPAKPAKK